MDKLQEYFELAVAFVPAAWWPFIDRYLVAALIFLLVSGIVVAVIDYLDMKDGRRDIWIIGKVAPWVAIAFEAAEAVIGLGGIKLPRVRDLQRFKELWHRGRALLGSPHPDDVMGEK